MTKFNTKTVQFFGNGEDKAFETLSKVFEAKKIKVEISDISEIEKYESALNSSTLAIFNIEQPQEVPELFMQINKLKPVFDRLNWIILPENRADWVNQGYEMGFSEVFQMPIIEAEIQHKLQSAIEYNETLSKLTESNVQLRITSQLLDHVLEIGKMASWILDIEANQLILNERFLNLFGTTLHATGKNPLNFDVWAERFLLSEDTEYFKKELLSLKEQQLPTAIRSLLCRFKYNPHDLGYMEFHFQMKENSEGKRQVMGVCIDVTHRKITDFENQKNKQLLQISHIGIETAKIGVYLVNHDGTIGYVNQHSCDMTGYSKYELCNMHITDLDGNANMQTWFKFRKEVHNQKFIKFQTKHKKKNGIAFNVEISAHYFQLEDQLFAYCFAREMEQSISNPSGQPPRTKSLLEILKIRNH